MPFPPLLLHVSRHERTIRASANILYYYTSHRIPMLNLHMPVGVNVDYHPEIILTITCAPPMHVQFVKTRRR